jgi:hypothetical protein
MLTAVEGAHLCILFQCKVCWFRNLEVRDPRGESDDEYLACIRRANLDAMLGKSPLMIRAHRRETIAVLENSRLIGKTPAYHPRGPFPVEDPMGMSLVVDMLLKSLVAKGRIADHVQFATLQKLWGTYTKNWESSPSGVKEGASFAKEAGRICPTSCLAQSKWFHNFLQGMEYRMGCQSKPNHGLLIGAIVHLLAILSVDDRRRRSRDWRWRPMSCERREHISAHSRLPCCVGMKAFTWTWPDSKTIYLGERMATFQ